MFFQFLIIFALSLSSEAFEEGTNALKIYLNQENLAKQINAHLCWRNVEKNKFVRSLHQEKYMVKLSNFEHVHPPRQYQIFVLDLDCENSDTVLQKMNGVYFRQPYRWFVFSKDQSDFNRFKDLNITLSTKFVTFYKTNNRSQHNAVFKFRDSRTVLYEDIPGLRFDHNFNFIRKRLNTHPTKINVSHIVLTSTFHETVYVFRNPHMDNLGKPGFIFTGYITEMLNVTPNQIYRDGWGYNGSPGIVTDLQKNTSEIGGTMSAFTAERLSIQDFVYTNVGSTVKFVLRSPSLSTVANIFVLSFGNSVWFALFILFLLASLILYLIVKFEWTYNQLPDNVKNNIPRVRANFFDSVLIQMGGLCQQGTDTEPSSFSGKVVLYVSLMSLMFVYTAYSASIVALLQSPSDSIQTVQDLLDSNIKTGLHNTSYNNYFFKIEKEPVRKALYDNKIVAEKNFFTMEEGVEKVRNEFFAFHATLPIFYYHVERTFLEHEKCGLVEILYLAIPCMGMTVRKNSDYKDLVTSSMKRIHETGLMMRIINRHIRRKPKCSSLISTFKNVGFQEGYFIVYVFCFGLIMALLLFIIEIYIKRLSESHAYKTLKCC